MTQDEWLRVLLAMGLLAAMFAFPIISLAVDARRKRRRAIEQEDASG